MHLLFLITASVLSLLHVSATAAPTADTSATANTHAKFIFPNQYHQCKKTLNYNVFFQGQKIGYYQRRIVWNDHKADIYTTSTVDVLVSKSKMNQHSKLQWSDTKQHFLTQSFQRTIKGLMSGKVSATFSKSGHRTTVNNDGNTQRYTNDSQPILDGDAIGSQMRLDLIEGKKQFNYVMQNSDEINHYYFAVTGNEKIKTHFGTLNTLRVNQVKKNDRQLSLWFAPSLDYQLVKATYNRKLLDLKAELVSKKIDCPPAPLFQ